MDAGRIWQRGASKGRKGSTNARMMQSNSNQGQGDQRVVLKKQNKYSNSDNVGINQNDFGVDPENQEQDTMMSALQRSLIAETLQGARAQVSARGNKASLNEPSRPFTPGDLGRHLLHGNDYSNRPGSSYQNRDFLGQAADEFASITSGQGLNNNFSSANKTKATTNSDSQSFGGFATGNASDDVLSIMEKHQPQNRGGLPQLQLNPNAPQLRAVLPGHVLPSIDPSLLNKYKKEKKIQQPDISQTQNILQLSPNSPTSPGEDSNTENQSAAQNKQKKAQQIVKQKLPNEAPSMKDFQDLIQSDKQNIEKVKRANQELLAQFENMQKEVKNVQNTQPKVKSSKVDEEVDDYDDELQDQMAESLFQEADQMGIFKVENMISEGVDYAAALDKIETKIQEKGQIDSSTAQQKQQKKSGKEGLEFEENDELYNQVIDDECNIVEINQKGGSAYEVEYNQVIQVMSKLCRNIVWNNQPANKDRKVKIDENEIVDLAPRIWALSQDYDKQTDADREKCFLQTILKGSFSLLGVKIPKCALKVSSCNIQIFFKILDQIVKAEKKFMIQNKHKKEVEIKKEFQEMLESIAASIDFKKVFNYLFETVRGLLIYAKEGDFDKMFIEENLIDQLGKVIMKCYYEHADLIIRLTSQIVNKKMIANDDKVYDLINYAIGAIKCFTQTSKEVQKITVQNQMIAVLSKAMQKTFVFGGNQNKQSMILVQISGALRNLANVEDSYGLLLHCKVLPKLCEIFGDVRFKGHKELILNVSRLLSKVSIDFKCAEQMVQTQNTKVFLATLEQYKDNSAIVIRIAFVLGNLTTHYVMARRELCQVENCFGRIICLAQKYLERDINGQSNAKDGSKEQKLKKYEEFSAGNIEDAITKIVKLLANLSTEEEFAQRNLLQDKSAVQLFIQTLVKAIDKRTLDVSEEFILNAISCITNILFYDLPQKELLTNDIRIGIFNSIKLYILATQNEEIQIETVRVLSNLSRHSALCDEFVDDKTFLEALTVVLDNTLRDLVYYSVGIIINVTLHPKSRMNILESTTDIVPKLIDVLKDSNIEDIDMSKVVSKALHNLTQAKQEYQAHINEYWSNDSINKLEEVLENLGDELDQIMDVASASELEEIQQLRKLINALNNDMPEPTLCCPFEGCGRKFKNQAELDNHISRRHAGQKIK